MKCPGCRLRKSSPGIVMVEVLCVVLIVSVGLTVVMRALSQAAAATGFALDYSRAALVADNILARVRTERALAGAFPDVRGICERMEGDISCRGESFEPGELTHDGGQAPETVGKAFSRLQGYRAGVAISRGDKKREVSVLMLLPPAGGGSE